MVFAPRGIFQNTQHRICADQVITILQELPRTLPLGQGMSWWQIFVCFGPLQLCSFLNLNYCSQKKYIMATQPLLNIQFFQRAGLQKRRHSFIRCSPQPKRSSLIHHLDPQQKIREVQLLLPSNQPPRPPGLSTCAPVDCCPAWRQKLHEGASGTKASWRIRSRKSMESLWVRRCLEQF